jgi:hypothetical protein
MKNITVRIIGLITLSIGAYTLYNTLTNILDSAVSVNFPSQISKLSLAWVAVYGGYQALKANGLGRKMLLAWLSYQALGMVLTIWIILYNAQLYPETNFSSFSSNQYLSIGFYIFCISALIFLATIKLDKDVLKNDSRHIKIAGKLLAVLSPGLGRVMVGNIWTGIGLSMFYTILIAGKFVFISTSNNSDLAEPTINFVSNLIVWIFFSQIDWHAVEHYGKSEGEQTTLDSKNGSVQATDG